MIYMHVNVLLSSFAVNLEHFHVQIQIETYHLFIRMIHEIKVSRLTGELVIHKES